jgi:hypothetical protein
MIVELLKFLIDPMYLEGDPLKRCLRLRKASARAPGHDMHQLKIQPDLYDGAHGKVQTLNA